MIFSTSSRRTSYYVAAGIMALGYLLSSCGGTSIPPKFAPGDSQQEPIPTKSFTLGTSASGSAGNEEEGETAAQVPMRGISQERVAPPPRRLAADPNAKVALRHYMDKRRGGPKILANNRGERGTGSNGVDLVDLSGNNLFVAGLTGNLSATIAFFANGDDTLLGSVDLSNSTSADVRLNGEPLGAGQDLRVVFIASGNVSSSIIPNSLFEDNKRYGFNALRRTDGSMIFEVFLDNAEPYGESDDGSRIVIDTAVDCRQDGNLGTVARYESADGLVMWDSNGDGIFGSASDQCILFDTNGDGKIDASDSPTAFAVDPNLDGSTGENETRLLGNNVPEDFISSVEMRAEPDNAIGNGLSTITLTVDVSPTLDGIPIGSTLRFDVRALSGRTNRLADNAGQPVFVGNGRKRMVQTLRTDDPQVQLLSGGRMRITKSIRTPVMEDDGRIDVQLRYNNSISANPIVLRLRHNDDLGFPVLANTAPTLATVNLIGTRQIEDLVGLEALSRSAKIVEGNLVEIIGSNFSTDPSEIVVTFGGTPAVIFPPYSSNKLNTSVPEGAQTGKINVIQGGYGASTSEDFVVAGPALKLEASSPANNANEVIRDEVIRLTFNQPISLASIENGLRVVTGTGSPVTGDFILTDDGTILTFTPGATLDANTLYRIEFTGYLEASNGVRFDKDLNNAKLPKDEGSSTVLRFTTGLQTSSDTTPPSILDAQVVANPPAVPGGQWTFDLVFDEPIDASTLLASSPASEFDSLRLVRDLDSSLISLSAGIQGDGDHVVIRAVDRLLGLESYSIEVTSGVTDINGNAMATAYSKTFSIPMLIDSLSNISGPIGSKILISGSTFPNDTSVAFVGSDGPVSASVLQRSSFDLLIEVPEGAQDGPVTLSATGVGSVSTSRNFVVTSAGYKPRVLTIGEGAFGVALDLDGKALVSYQRAGEIGLLDLRNEVVLDLNPDDESTDRIPVGGVPSEAVLDRTGRLGFTTNFGEVESPGESIFIIDMVAQRILSTVRVGKRPTRMAVSPDNRYLYVTAFLDDRVDIIDLTDFTVAGTIEVGLGPNGVVISPDNTSGYVCNYLEGTVSVFDVVSREVTDIIEVGLSPARVQFSPDAASIFVSNNGGNSLTIIDASTHAISQTLTGFAGPSAMAFLPDGSELFVTNRNNNTIYQVVKDEESGTWSIGSVRIATSNKPAGLAIMSDSSLMIITNEGSGEVLAVNIGDPQPVIEGFSLNNEGSVGRSTFSADVRQTVWINGRGFGTDPESVSATIRGTPLNVRADGFSSTQILVQIPLGARSGPVVVTVPGIENEVSSNDVPLQVTGKSPTVIQMNPGDGSSNVDPDSNVVVEFSEPIDPDTVFTANGEVRRNQGIGVVRIVRLKDDGSGDPAANVAGTWKIDPFNTKLTFTLAGNTVFRRSNSNNVYEVRINPSVKDLFGNSVLGAVTSVSSANNPLSGASATAGLSATELGYRGRFKTTDVLGPRIRQATYRDSDNNGIGAGDQLELTFDEDLFYISTEFNVTGKFSLSAGSLGVDATATLGSTSRSLAITLGSGAAFALDGSALINVVNNTISEVKDYSNNDPIEGTAIAIEVDTASDNGVSPRLIAASYEDTDNSLTINAGDRLMLKFNEPVLTGASLGTPADRISITNGNISDATFAARSSGEDFKLLVVELGATSSLTIDTSEITLNGTGDPALVPSDSIADLLGNLAYAEEFSTATVTSGFAANEGLSGATKPIYVDVQNTKAGVSEGDVIIFTFSGPVELNTTLVEGGIVPTDLLRLGVEGDRFGTGARVAQPAFVNNFDGGRRLISANQIVVILGKSPVFQLEGDFPNTGNN